MNTNDPGREPEPTDAVMISMGALQMAINALRRDEANGMKARGEIADEIVSAIRQRPMPDTPAPDEVAQLPEHFCTYPDCRCKPDELDGWCAKGLPTPISLWRQNTALTARIADLEREVADRNSDYINDSATLAEISAENTAIRAKCSDLERENAEMKAEVVDLRVVYAAARGLCFGTDWNHGNHAIKHGYRRSLIAAVKAVSPGKEAPDAGK